MRSIQELQHYLLETIYRDKLKPGQSLLCKDYAYPITFDLAHTANAVEQIQMQANADFLCLALSIRVNIAGALQTVDSVPVPNFRILMSDTSSNEQWTASAIDVAQWIGGNTQNGFLKELYYPRWIGGRTSVSANFTSFEAAQDYTVDFAMHGMLVYVLGA